MALGRRFQQGEDSLDRLVSRVVVTVALHRDLPAAYAVHHQPVEDERHERAIHEVVDVADAGELPR
jgi:hypothetical protein